MAIGRVAIVGAGVAGLTAAIGLARAGVAVRLFEQSPALTEIGAGLQLSPNATRILTEFGVLPLLMPAAVRPERIALRKATSLRRLSSVPLGAWASERWGSPYLTVHRADLQAALLARARQLADIELVTGAALRDAAFHADGVTLSIEHDGAIREERAALVVGADGVWSALRGLAFGRAESRDTGYIAWRTVVRPGGDTIVAADEVTAFLHPDFHLVAYPVRAGGAVNLVAVTRGRAGIGWSNEAGAALLEQAMAGTAAPLRALVAGAGVGAGPGPWTTWPIHEAPALPRWTEPSGLALIGDAAHAMPPYAAQGAAMAIEDAAVIARLAARSGGDVGTLLAAYERMRRPRIRRVAARGAFNRFTWHARGPVALARDLAMAARPQAANARDLDWLYGWKMEDEAGL